MYCKFFLSIVFQNTIQSIYSPQELRGSTIRNRILNFEIEMKMWQKQNITQRKYFTNKKRHFSIWRLKVTLKETHTDKRTDEIVLFYSAPSVLQKLSIIPSFNIRLCTHLLYNVTFLIQLPWLHPMFSSQCGNSDLRTQILLEALTIRQTCQISEVSSHQTFSNNETLLLILISYFGSSRLPSD